MSSEETIWAQLICPVPIAALSALTEMAPPGACIRSGGQTFHEGAFHDVVEVFVPAGGQETAETTTTTEQENG